MITFLAPPTRAAWSSRVLYTFKKKQRSSVSPRPFSETYERHLVSLHEKLLTTCSNVVMARNFRKAGTRRRELWSEPYFCTMTRRRLMSCEVGQANGETTATRRERYLLKSGPRRRGQHSFRRYAACSSTWVRCPPTLSLRNSCKHPTHREAPASRVSSERRSRTFEVVLVALSNITLVLQLLA
jgi:hypothetical protein